MSTLIRVPDFYFLSIFAALALLPDWMEVLILFVAPALGIGFLLALPFISGTGEKSAQRRPVAVLSVLFIMLTIGTLTYMGPDLSVVTKNECLERCTPSPVQYVQGRTPTELKGAIVLQNKQCRNCHSLGGEGGERGPTLDCGSDASDQRRTRAPGDSGGRQHAGLWQETDSGGNRSAGGIHVYFAAQNNPRRKAVREAVKQDVS